MIHKYRKIGYVLSEKKGFLMSNFYQWISKLLPSISKKKRSSTFPQLPASTNTTQPNTHGEEYPLFVTKHYKEKSDTVWEYSKEKELQGNQINLVTKENRTIFLIHIKQGDRDINLNDMHNFEKESQFFLQTNPIFEHYEIQLLYVMPSLQIEESAYKYMKQHPKIGYKIVK